MTVNLTQTATVDPTGLLHLAGGAFTAGAFVNQGQTVLEGVGASLTATTFTNEHVLAGNGLVNAALQNEASGRVEVASGQHLVFAEPGNTNAGEIKLLGGIVEFAEDLTNAATGSSRS